MAGTTDLGLIERAREGDLEALERLLLARAGWLSNYLAEQLPVHFRSTVDEDDLLQQTFFHAFRAIGQLRTSNEHAFDGWLASIAQNQLRDAVKALRRQKRSVQRGVQRTATGTSSMIQLVDLLLDSKDTPLRLNTRNEAIQAVQIGIAGLPADQQQAIWLSAIEGKSIPEAAEELGKTEAAVRGLIHRGKQNLRISLGRSSRWLDKKR